MSGAWLLLLIPVGSALLYVGLIRLAFFWYGGSDD